MKTIIMAAPNGARHNKADHPKLPVTINETIEASQACLAAGASIVHAHVRDREQRHVLDVGLYRELMQAFNQSCHGVLQLTTEAVGRYSPQAQFEVLSACQPEMISVAYREISQDSAITKRFYGLAQEQKTHVQTIVYSLEDLQTFCASEYASSHVLVVFGRYGAMRASVDDVLPFIPYLNSENAFCCAFGDREQAVLTMAANAGAHCRVGFENNLKTANGGLAADNAAQVASLAASLRTADHDIATVQDARDWLAASLNSV
ncbi:MAG: 3-keto-5-aminohexanoate cleavage protein [Gammaproteobacteria bacterium]|nr:3-keto-5-aminohexanoate cleavage protein [Gammaproteobacteria bacterium]